MRWDRFSRNMENGVLMLHELRSYGVDVKCLEETYDTSDPSAVLLRAIKMIDRFQKTVADLEAMLFKIDEKYVEGDLEKDSYSTDEGIL